MYSRVERDSPSRRIFLLIIFTFLAMGFVGLRLFYLQVLSHGYYLNLADNQHKLEQELIPSRGEIFIRDRYSPDPYPAASNVNKPLLYVVPQQVTDAPKLSLILAENLGLDRKEVLAKITDQAKKYVPVAKEVEEPLADKLAGMHLPGVYFEDETHQIYPEGQLAASVLGFVGFDGDRRVGRYGLESYFEKELAGTPGNIEGTAGPSGVWITGGERKVQPAQDGVNLILTIDRAIQFKAEEVLDRTVQAHGAKGGSVIVMDPKTGAVLAMASYPPFDPNHFGDVKDVSVFNNSAIQMIYEPGSVMKAVTFAAGLDLGVIAPDMTYDDPGAVTFDKYTIRNAQDKNYGNGVTMTQVLENSINTGAIFAEQKIGHEKFKSYLEAFGLGSPTGVTLPFEVRGSIDNLKKGGDLYPATMSFGQGMTVTPLQLVTAYAAIANGGKLYQPYVVDEKVYPDGRKEKTEKKLVREVISQHTASTLAAMLVSVVERGHGKRAAVPGYFIAGKTGTAQVSYADRPGYDENRNIGTFVGFGPVDDPVFVMIVKIDEPQDVRFAESTTAPAFGEIAQFILNYYQVPKTR